MGPRQAVTTKFSADGKHWVEAATANTGPRGRFTISAEATRDGRWRARYRAGTSNNGATWITELSSFSKAVPVDVRYRTAVTGFNASPNPVRKGRTLTVSGTLSRFAELWKGLGGRTVDVYFLPSGSKTWRKAASLGTDRYGGFRRRFKAVRDGTWRAVYRGDVTYLPVTGNGDYVDVR